jgi:hypothetical protein
MGLFSRKRPRTEEGPAGEELDEVEPEVAEPDDEGDEVTDEVEPDEPAADEPDEPVEPADDDDDDDEGDEPADEVRSSDDASADGEDGPSDGSGQIEFALGDWGARERQLIDSELAAARVRRAWEAGTLVVAASDADVVDDLIDYIEERIALDLAPDAEPVIYEVKDWPPGLEERFLELLIDARIPHDRGYHEVIVGIADEERVDELVEQVTAAWEDEQPTDDEIGGPDTQDVLSELFVSSDRLLHSPSDRAATVRFDDAAETAQTMSLPFGFDEATWGGITDLVGALREKLAEAESTDDEIVEAATALRTHLRPLV